MACPKCGGTIIGDGYTSVIACEFAEIPEGIEPDAGPIYCDYEEEARDIYMKTGYYQ